MKKAPNKKQRKAIYSRLAARFEGCGYITSQFASCIGTQMKIAAVCPALYLSRCRIQADWDGLSVDEITRYGKRIFIEFYLFEPKEMVDRWGTWFDDTDERVTALLLCKEMCK